MKEKKRNEIQKNTICLEKKHKAKNPKPSSSHKKEVHDEEEEREAQRENFYNFFCCCFLYIRS